ncbi:hypothetical protein BH11BAC4_BH11BAC4_23910 [soil metagenome]
MLPFAYYLLKVVICSGVLFGYYWFFLRNKIYHSYNRFYLLAIVVLSLALPLLKINIWHKAGESQPGVIKMLQVVNSSDEYMDEVILYSHYNHISKEEVFSLIYFVVCAVFLFLFVQVLFRIWLLLKKNPATAVENIHFIKTNAKGTPFSFLKFIFWNDAIDIETKAGRQVFKHEVAHVQEKHSFDKLFINFILVFCWCNPFFWFIRKELNMIHEFIADKKAVEDGDVADFAAMILQATYPQHRFPIANNFFYSPIKRRLAMLTKQNHAKVNYISRLLVLPLAMIVFAAFTLKAKTYSDNIVSQGKTITVVVDAGHGGTDNGATGAGDIHEKDISLVLAKRIKELNKSNNIRIILTRETDIYQTPQQKAIFAKEAGADLFISIHLDGAPKDSKDMRTGMYVYVAKDQYANSDASKLLASAVITNFQKNYGLTVTANPEQRQHGIWVLQENTFPSILIEAGCINNPKDLEYLKTDKAVETFALNILEAINTYRFQKESSAIINTVKTIEDTSIARPFTGLVKTPVKNDMYISADQIIVNEHGATFSGDIKLKLDKLADSKLLIILNGEQASVSAFKKIDWKRVSFVRLLSAETAKKTYGEKGINGVMIINEAAAGVFSDKKLIIIDGNVKGQSLNEAMAAIEGRREIESMNLLNETEAVKKYGKTAAEGAIEIITKNIANQDISFTLSGIAGPKVPVSELGNIKEITLSNPDYHVTHATIYFSGNGFTNVVTVDIPNGFLKNIVYFEKLLPGSIVTFDNILVESKSGKKTEVKGKSFSFYDITKDDIIFTKVENEPEFPGGKDGWRDFLTKNLDAGMPVDEGWKAGTYKIVVDFIVDTEGNVSDVKTADHPGSKTAQQCVDLIKNGPKWIPAVQNGKKVKAYRKQPITFVVSEQ